MRLLDSDVAVDLLREHPPALAWLANLDEPLAVPGFVVLELQQGCRDRLEVRRVAELVHDMPVVWPDEERLSMLIAEYPDLHLRDRLGLLDGLIAASAVHYEAVLCTFNVKHYRAFPGLVIEQPYIR